MIGVRRSDRARGFGSIVSLSESDALSAHRYFDRWRGAAGYIQPERRLMFAVLLDAVECFQKYPLVRGTNATRLFVETNGWIFEDDHEWPFSFINVCEAVGMDPHYLRKGLLRWKERAIREQHPHVGDYPHHSFQIKDLPYELNRARR